MKYAFSMQITNKHESLTLLQRRTKSQGKRGDGKVVRQSDEYRRSSSWAAAWSAGYDTLCAMFVAILVLTWYWSGDSKSTFEKLKDTTKPEKPGAR